MSLAEIFELRGGEYYRRLEREELDRLIQAGTPGIVATGGGLVTDHAAFARLREASVTIWLSSLSRLLRQASTWICMEVRPVRSSEA